MSDLRNEAKAVIRTMMTKYNVKYQRVYSEKLKALKNTNIDGRTIKFFDVEGDDKNIEKVIDKSNKRLKQLGLFIELRNSGGSTDLAGAKTYTNKSIQVLQIK